MERKNKALFPMNARIEMPNTLQTKGAGNGWKICLRNNKLKKNDFFARIVKGICNFGY